MKTTPIAVALTVAWMFAAPTGWAADDKDHAELAKALKDAKGPAAARPHGQRQGRQANLGKVVKAEPITSGDDLAETLE
jgi:hypothetical protein